MGAEILGTLTCPMCGNEHATVHHHQGRKSKLYYRCYTSPGGNDARCGTIQCTGPDGQAFIEKHMKLWRPEAFKAPTQPAANDPAPVDSPPKGVEPPKSTPEAPKGGGVFDGVISFFSAKDEDE